MGSFAPRAFSTLVAAGVCSLSFSLTFGQRDDFQDGTTQGWVVNLLGMGGGAPPPENVATGGPLGAGDRYMRLTSLGGTGAGSRLVVINPAQWSGNYTAAGVTVIAMNLNNFGNSDLNLRILFGRVVGGPPSDIAASTNSVLVPAGSGWVTALFPVAASDLTPLLGSVQNAIGEATLIRIFHNPDPTFPPPAIAASLGVDNVTAVPEPATMAALLGGIAAVVVRRRRRSYAVQSQAVGK